MSGYYNDVFRGPPRPPAINPILAKREAAIAKHEAEVTELNEVRRLSAIERQHTPNLLNPGPPYRTCTTCGALTNAMRSGHSGPCSRAWNKIRNAKRSGRPNAAQNA